MTDNTVTVTQAEADTIERIATFAAGSRLSDYDEIYSMVFDALASHRTTGAANTPEREAEGNVREWFYYPIEMPVTANGQGPATIGKDAAKMTYEVWDQYTDSHGSFDFLPDAINEAIRLNAALSQEPETQREGDIAQRARGIAASLLGVDCDDSTWLNEHVATRAALRALSQPEAGEGLCGCKDAYGNRPRADCPYCQGTNIIGGKHRSIPHDGH